jgi:hypothetical protein
MPDITLTCSECHRPFAFTTGEQVFYAGQTFPPPAHCPDCRARRKAAQETARAEAAARAKVAARRPRGKRRR